MIIIIQILSEKSWVSLCLWWGRGGLQVFGKRNVGSPSQWQLCIGRLDGATWVRTLDTGQWSQTKPQACGPALSLWQGILFSDSQSAPNIELKYWLCSWFLMGPTKELFFLLRNVKSSHLIANIDAKLLIEVISIASLIMCSTYWSILRLFKLKQSAEWEFLREVLL